MTLLPFNTEVKRCLHARYRRRLEATSLVTSVLPLLGMLLFSTQLDDYIKQQSALGHGVSARMLVACIVPGLPILNYLLGWVLSAAGARWLLGWPAEKVRAVFLRSEVPSHWLDPAKGPPRTPEALQSEFWAPIHARGMRHFVLTRGVVAFGGFMFVLFYAVPATIDLWWRWSLGAAVVAASLAIAVGTAFALLLWWTGERHYRSLPPPPTT